MRVAAAGALTSTDARRIVRAKNHGRLLANQHCMRDERTNVAWEHQEVIVSQAAILLGVNECLDVNAIALGVLVLEYLEGFGVVQSIGRGVGHGVAVGDRHSGIGIRFSRNREECVSFD
jgi:hypothetical protein